jgi:hypothetical protein
MKAISLTLWLWSFVLCAGHSQLVERKNNDYGAKLCRQLLDQKQLIVHYDYSIDKSPTGGSLTLVTLESEKLEKLAAWNETGPLPVSVEKLVGIARAKAAKDAMLVEFKVAVCHFDPKWKFAVVTFRNKEAMEEEPPSKLEDKVVYLLLDGTTLAEKTRQISESDAMSLMEHGIPRKSDK